MARSFSGDAAIRYVISVNDVVLANNNWPYRGMSIPLARDVIASSCAGKRPCFVVLVAFCPTRRRSPTIDDSDVQAVSGAESATHHCVVRRGLVR